MKVSIIVPTLREKLLDGLLRSIDLGAQGVEHEIVVISPFSPKGRLIVWLKEDVPQGTCNAIARGYEAASGDIIVLLSDDVLVTRGWLRHIVDFIVTHERNHFPFVAGQNKSGNYFGTVYGLYYPYYPAISRASAEAVGGLFSREFISHYGDPDLGLRVWRNGGRAQLCYQSKLIFSSIERYFSAAPKKSMAFDVDFRAFKAKWSSTYGVGWGAGFRDVNRDYKLVSLVDGSYFNNAPPTDTYAEPTHNDWLEAPLLRKAGMYVVEHASSSTIASITKLTHTLRTLSRR
ncbi:glycosyltransferase family 2 protein [Trinickia acidisoli]|uniref:glycosyltransferase family 2 protein n=1 Tax=Trinickia acidisoli TaxID=2767482 RepID=UPI001A8C4F0D|nr:glycosyltransferase family A protein [Trinickia acidisoli]